MKLPVGGARIGRRFEPSERSDDVVPAVTVQVAHADPVAVAAGAYHALHKGPVLYFKPRQRVLHLMAAPLREHFAGLAVVIEIHQERELDAMAVFDRVFLPLSALGAGILVPPDAVAVRSGTDDVGIAVAIYVKHKIGEVFSCIPV